MSKIDAPVEDEPKRTLSDICEELCPGSLRRNWPSWAGPFPENDNPAIEPMMTDEEEDVPAPVENWLERGFTVANPEDRATINALMREVEEHNGTRDAPAPVEDTAVELLPCPFCGGEDIDPKGWISSEDITGPACGTCGAAGGSVLHRSSENVTAWNTRTPEARTRELEKRLAEATDLLKYMIDRERTPYAEIVAFLSQGSEKTK